MSGVDTSILIGLSLSLAALSAARVAARAVWCRAQPDEWLLCVRDGRLVAAGVGISRVRRPGDVIARFSSTLQRVAFACDAISVERVPVRVEGFIFWSVSPDGDAPFRAFSRLGIADLNAPPPALRHPRHLLTSPQHKAFQQILTAVVQRHASTLPLELIVQRQDALVAGLVVRLREFTEELGAQVDQVEILSARPSDETVREQLGAPERERIREESERVRREVASRIAADESRSALALASERARLLDAERDVRAQEIAAERETELARIASRHELAQREAALAASRAREASQERRALELAEAESAHALLRSRAEAERDAELLRAEALERKSAAVLAHERHLDLAAKIAGSLKVTDARWVSVGSASPAASVGAMFAEVREVLEATSRGQA